MKLHIDWMRPVPLKDGRREDLIYTTDLSRLPETGGVYVFGRRYKGHFNAIYVGKADNIRRRMKGQFNNLRLMNCIKKAKKGRRVLLIGQFRARPGQRPLRCLPIIERTLIRYFLFEGDDLVNKQGTRLRRHEVRSDGKQPKRFIPRLMYLDSK